MHSLLHMIKTMIFGTTPAVQSRDDSRQEEARLALDTACEGIKAMAAETVTPMASGTVTADTVISPKVVVK